jgi:hypothetical protein
MKSFHRIRLRFWALCQFLYDLTLRRTDEDHRISRQELWDVTVKTGHCNKLCFLSLHDLFPVLRNAGALSNNRLVLGFARANLKRLADMGRPLSGLLGSYLAAQRRHLDACEHCQKAVCDVIREDIMLFRKVRALFDAAGMTPPERRPKN